MLVAPVRWASIVCSLLVIAGWGWFVVDETQAASTQTQQEIAGHRVAATVDPGPDAERVRERSNNPVHERIDDANDVLLRPFAPLAQSWTSTWARRTVPAALGLLVYGLGLAVLARFIATR